MLFCEFVVKIQRYYNIYCSLNSLYDLSYVFIYLVLTFSRRHSISCFRTVGYFDHTLSYTVALLCYSAVLTIPRLRKFPFSVRATMRAVVSICIFALFLPTYAKGENATLFYTCVISYGILIWHSNVISEIESAQRFVIRSVLVVINPSSLFTVTDKLWVQFSKELVRGFFQWIRRKLDWNGLSEKNGTGKEHSSVRFHTKIWLIFYRKRVEWFKLNCFLRS